MIRKLWMRYQLFTARNNAQVEEEKVKIAQQNAKYFHIQAILIERELQ